MDLAWFLAYSGVSSEGLRWDSGSASCDSTFFKASSCSGVRRTIQTGFPRHSTVNFSPGLILAMSTSTAAPAALARSEGLKLLTHGTAFDIAGKGVANPSSLLAALKVAKGLRL